MATLTRQQRVFNAVFPPSESPFLTGHVRVGVLRPEQQRAWDTVTTAVYPHFSQLLEEHVDIAEGTGQTVCGLMSRMAVEGRAEGLGGAGTDGAARN
jgi:hypothetical protein